jgi:hypothetical protein
MRRTPSIIIMLLLAVISVSSCAVRAKRAATEVICSIGSGEEQNGSAKLWQKWPLGRNFRFYVATDGTFEASFMEDTARPDTEFKLSTRVNRGKEWFCSGSERCSTTPIQVKKGDAVMCKFGMTQVDEEPVRFLWQATLK